MAEFGLTPLNPMGGPTSMTVSVAPVIGSIVPFGPAPSTPQPVTPVVAIDDALAAHLRKLWTAAREHKRPVEQLMVRAQQARRGEYTAEERALIQKQGGAEIFMMLTPTKSRQAIALFRDVLIGSGSDKPWTVKPTPKPELPDDVMAGILQAAVEHTTQLVAMGMPVSTEELRDLLQEAEAAARNKVMEEARAAAEIAEIKMEDQLVEGGFLEALSEFIDDLPTFKTAFIKGPVVRKKPSLTWVQGANGWEVQVEDRLIYEWERVSPFDIYPSKHATSVNNGYLFEHLHLTRRDLSAMIGVEGYSEEKIRKVLDEYGQHGYKLWMDNEQERKPESERGTSLEADPDTIDALQFWGSVQGSLLIEWGLTAEEIPDPLAEYSIDAILINNVVIRAVLNADPLGRRPYYATSYERLAGQFWGNCLWDLIRDCQSMCNAAARALANNLGIASGPQVAVNTDRLPPGEQITEMYPWKIWQTTSDPMGSSAAPIIFFQPDSHANELMTVYERFSVMADEYSGLPRYMTGGEAKGGAGRTASGMSMMITNASKTIKQVIGNIDQWVLQPLLERLYYYNKRYGDDEDLQGDLKIVARGALSLVAKEAAQVRINEFLATTANPIDMQILGLDGRAELLREAGKRLDLNVDRVIPTVEEIKRRALMAQLQALAQPAPQPGSPATPGGPSPSGQALADETATTDNFSPMRQAA